MKPRDAVRIVLRFERIGANDGVLDAGIPAGRKLPLKRQIEGFEFFYGADVLKGAGLGSLRFQAAAIDGPRALGNLSPEIDSHPVLVDPSNNEVSPSPAESNVARGKETTERRESMAFKGNAFEREGRAT